MGSSYSSLYFRICTKFFYNKKENINDKPCIGFLKYEQTVGEPGRKQVFEAEVTTMVQATSYQHVGQNERLLIPSVDETWRNWNSHPLQVCKKSLPGLFVCLFVIKLHTHHTAQQLDS